MTMAVTGAGVWSNPTLWVPMAAGLLVQLIKFVTTWICQRQIDFRVLVQPGGMPSAHSAVVTALATAVGIREGTASTAFALACILAGIVMYDAAGVRRAAGRQARILNRIVEDLYHGHPIAEERLWELLGHTPFEVIVGAVIGFAFAWGWLALA
jgi:acid phosphatase family membrane protein YuiD